MKKMVLIFLVLVSSCAQDKFELSKARKVAEKAISLIHSRNYIELANLYSEDFKTSETKEERERKFEQILNVIGNATKITIQDSTSITANQNGEPTLRYKVETNKLTVIEAYSFVQEGSDYMISGIDIQQMKQ